MLALSSQERVIDCKARPLSFPDWVVEEHKGKPQLLWDDSATRLYAAPCQQEAEWTDGHEIRKQLRRNPLLNANVLDYLLAHPVLIPDAWDGKVVCFWGTIYRQRNTENALSLRALARGHYGWYWYWREINSIFLRSHVAALRAN